MGAKNTDISPIIGKKTNSKSRQGFGTLIIESKLFTWQPVAPFAVTPAHFHGTLYRYP